VLGAVTFVAQRASTFNDWQRGGVLRQPDLVAGCRQEVSHLSGAGSTASASAATMPDPPTRGALQLLMQRWTELVEDCKKRFVISDVLLFNVNDDLRNLRSVAVAIGLPALAQASEVKTSTVASIASTSTTLRILYTPREELILVLNIVAEELTGRYAPPELHGEFVDSYWAREKQAQLEGQRAPAPAVAADIFVNEHLAVEVTAKRFGDNARIVLCMLPGIRNNNC